VFTVRAASHAGSCTKKEAVVSYAVKVYSDFWRTVYKLLVQYEL